jgi:hypothetical protein
MYRKRVGDATRKGPIIFIREYTAIIAANENSVRHQHFFQHQRWKILDSGIFYLIPSRQTIHP